MSDNIRQDLFSEFLECTICLDVPASPIHHCLNGHIVCGICVENVKICGLCKTDLQVSILAERLSRQMNFESKCPQSSSGCNFIVKAAEMKEHLLQCYFRDFKCFENKCKGMKVPLVKYPQHLEECHGGKLFDSSSITWANDIDYTREYNWRTMHYVLKHGETFILHYALKNQTFYFWITLLGDKEKAQKFRYTVEIVPYRDKVMKMAWEHPVLPFHDYPKYTEPCLFFVMISAKDLFVKRSSKDGSIDTNYFLELTYKIF